MRLFFFIFIVSQLLNFLVVFAEKVKKEPNELEIKWERVRDEKSNNFKKIIWKSYNNDETYFENINNKKNNQGKILLNENIQKKNFENQKKNKQELLEIKPHIPLNNFLNSGDFIISTNWVSTFSGGAGGGTGHQNYGIKFNYGLSEYSLISLYFSETDDPLYNLIKGELIPNNWASIALAYKKQIFESSDSKICLL